MEIKKIELSELKNNFIVPKKEKPLPQSESEWMATKVFSLEAIKVGENEIQCAFSQGGRGNSVTAMVGGLPRDPSRREKLPLINKLYGNLAVELSHRRESSVLYNQPGTGRSTGDWEKGTITTRAHVLTEVSKYFYIKGEASSLAIVGTSAGGYMAVRALDELQKNGVVVSKLALLSPAAYPESVEEIPYGENFSNTIRTPWDVSTSPIFPLLTKFVKEGGSVLITFFEHDDPPIPRHIQEYYKSFVKELSDAGGDIEIVIIEGVAHNFRKIGIAEGDNIVDNQSVRVTTSKLTSFLTNT